jgi:hypothetical protein
MTRRAILRRTLGAAVALALGGSLRAFAAESSLAFNELYAKQSVLGLQLSDKTKALAGKTVRILGYLAPPLKPDVGFFVLTRAPVALCPFCNSDADWPSDIVVVYPRSELNSTQDGLPVAVVGTLELGSKIDARTGFVSLVRVVDADFTVVR